MKKILVAGFVCLIAYPAFAGVKAVAPSIFGNSASVVTTISKIKTDTGGGL